MLTTGDLTAKSRALLKQPLATDWSYDTYNSRFEATLEDQRSFIANAILVYVNAALNKYDADVHLCVVYFLAVSGHWSPTRWRSTISWSNSVLQVYYPVESQKSSFRNDVQRKAFSTAESLTGAVSGQCFKFLQLGWHIWRTPYRQVSTLKITSRPRLGDLQSPSGKSNSITSIRTHRRTSRAARLQP